MNTNRLYAALVSVIATITLGVGFFIFSSGTGSTAPASPSTEQSITVSARDTSGAALRGVSVRLVGAGNKTITSGTTTAGGEVSLTFDPEPGTYVVTADEPTGYHANDDKDGGASDVNGLNCSNVYLCIYLTATEVRHDDGTTSVTVTLSYVRPEQVNDLDDLWFEMTPPGAAAVEEESFVEVGGSDDILIGQPADDVLTETDGGTDDIPVVGSDDEVQVGGPEGGDLFERCVPAPPGLGHLCVNTLHQPVTGQNSESGIWVRGEVYGLAGGWIWVEGPTINNGDPLQITVENGLFDAPLGINQYGDHPIKRFELQSGDPGIPSVDLLPILEQGPGTVFPVDADEGPIFDDECFDFDPPVVDEVTGEVSDEAPAPTPDQSDEQQAAQALGEAQVRVDTFLEAFVDDHVTGDAQALLATLHPSVPLAFGEQACTEYVIGTTGSITGATALTVGPPTSIELDTPNGPITFPDAVPFTVEFTLGDGSAVVNDAHLAQHDGESRWLTTCGFDG